MYDIENYEINIQVPLNENRCKDVNKFSCKMWNDISQEWTSDNIEYVSELEGAVECKIRKLGTIGVFEYDPTDYTREMKDNYGIHASYILLVFGMILAALAIIFSKE